MFWITDEFVVATLASSAPLMPAWLAWIAILIDYLELPVMWDTVLRFSKALSGNRVAEFLKEDFRKE
jgi:hypothetical protein